MMRRDERHPRPHDRRWRSVVVGVTTAAVTALVTIGASPLAHAAEVPGVPDALQGPASPPSSDAWDQTVASTESAPLPDTSEPASETPVAPTDDADDPAAEPVATGGHEPAPTRTDHPKPTPTSAPTETPKPTPTAGPTHTPRPTHTPHPTHTPRPTHTPTPTSTPTTPPPRPSTITVEKEWVINGAAAVPDGDQPEGLEATLLLDGESTPWGETRSGYSQGESVTVSETTTVVDIDLCEFVGATIRGTTIDGTVDLGGSLDVTLAKGANELTVTNEVDCTARLQLFMTTNDGSSVASWTLGAEGGGSTIDFAQGLSGVQGFVSYAALYELTQSPGDPRYVSFIDPSATAGTTASWDCVQVDADGDTIPGFTDGVDGDVTVPIGARVECTALNSAATLRLIKNVNNDGGGIQQPDHWTLHTEPVDDVEGIARVSQPGSPSGFAVTVRPETEYSIWETAPPTLGYTLVGPTCTDGETSVPVRAAGDGRYVVTVAVGAVVSCTFLNDDGPAVWRTAKTSTPPSGTVVKAGDVITYTVTATYVSGVEARDVVVIDDLSGLIGVADIIGSPTVTAGSVARAGSTFRWTIPVLSSTETLTFSALVTATDAVELINRIDPTTVGPCDPCRTVHTTRAEPAPTHHDPGTPARLAATGGQVQPLAALGLGVLALGAILADTRRRRFDRR